MRERLLLVLLLVFCFGVAAHLVPRQTERQAASGRSGNLLAMMLGDGRKMFANHIFAKADAYFHRGNYPSIFDLNARSEENHMAGATVDGEHDEDEHEDDHHDHDHDHGGHRCDWIAHFGERFYPSGHVHLGKGDEREMLPWLRLSAELDPHRVETYTVTAYWLRRINKVDEAGQFLREGLRANPDSYEILFELGRLYYEHHHDVVRSRNVWEAALRRWRQHEPAKEEPNLLALSQIAVSLARLEADEGNLQRAIDYLELGKTASPNPDSLQSQIDELRAQLGNVLRSQPSAARP
jgi:tetratricopeptide (TPR) repeat protein